MTKGNIFDTKSPVKIYVLQDFSWPPMEIITLSFSPRSEELIFYKVIDVTILFRDSSLYYKV
jgi:hypothetical protein